jgi:hypothetical protein
MRLCRTWFVASKLYMHIEGFLIFSLFFDWGGCCDVNAQLFISPTKGRMQARNNALHEPGIDDSQQTRETTPLLMWMDQGKVVIMTTSNEVSSYPRSCDQPQATSPSVAPSNHRWHLISFCTFNFINMIIRKRQHFQGYLNCSTIFPGILQLLANPQVRVVEQSVTEHF